MRFDLAPGFLAWPLAWPSAGDHNMDEIFWKLVCRHAGKEYLVA